MKIKLESNPSDAARCVKILAEDGRDMLVQTDWDWPSVASAFGWSLRGAQKCLRCGSILKHDPSKSISICPCKRWRHACAHSGTDGTIDCPECGVTANEFIASARAWIDDNDGAEVDDPGYFEPMAA